jgi:class 3 adenylate cyclase
VSDSLQPVIDALDATGWSAVVTDADWRIVWSSKEIALILGDEAASDLGIGRHMLETRALAAFTIIHDDSVADWVRVHAPYALYDGSLTREELAEVVDERFRSIVDEAEPTEPPARWTLRLAVRREEDVGVVAHGERVVAADGRVLGNVFMYGSALPASVLWLLNQGDQRQFTRLAGLVEPGRRPAAVLFADIAGSTELSRHMASAAYFDLIREITQLADDAIIEGGGIVGTHAGDGLSAFFLADQCGSSPSAALGALRAARAIAVASAERDVKMNIAIHWGATLYIGQVATSGRLEVTALGDEVNECARIQEAGHGGVLLATKALVERLDPEQAQAEGIDADELRYTLVSELPEAPEKSVRDAGGIAVVDVSVS